MKLYGIIECFLDYKGVDATNFGVYKTLDDAKKELKDIVSERFSYTLDDKSDEEWDIWFKSCFQRETEYEILWVYDDGDTVTKYYINELSL